MEKTTPRCPTCKLGFIDFGKLPALHRFNDHLNQAQDRWIEATVMSH